MIYISQKLTIINYHYIRDLTNTRYPKIKGLTIDKFIGQLEYCQKHYKFINMEDCIKGFQNKEPLPKNPCLLTFDDGFIDHYTTAFPILANKEIPGAFFPSAKSILEHKMLDVHKIHFILAKTSDYKELIKIVLKKVKGFRKNYSIADDKTLISKLAVASTWDPPEIVFIKRLLQIELPPEVKKIICSDLFQELVCDNEQVFSRELYMTVDQLKLMNISGMYIGGHGYSHQWLGSIPEEAQRHEIYQNYTFLEQIYNKKPINWVMSYPYGSYNETTISLLTEYSCVLGLGVEIGLASIEQKIKFNIPRLDTNHIPFTSESEINNWTKLSYNSNNVMNL